MSDLFEQVLHHLEGEEKKRQTVFSARHGSVDVIINSFGPDRWIERAALGKLMAIDVLAVILFSVRDEFDLDRERMIVEQWADALSEAARAGEIKARDPASILPLRSLPAGIDWLITCDDADSFVAARGMGWTVSEVVNLLLDQSRRDGERWTDPDTGETIRQTWLRGYEPKQQINGSDTGENNGAANVPVAQIGPPARKTWNKWALEFAMEIYKSHRDKKLEITLQELCDAVAKKLEQARDIAASEDRSQYETRSKEIPKSASIRKNAIGGTLYWTKRVTIYKESKEK